MRARMLAAGLLAAGLLLVVCGLAAAQGVAPGATGTAPGDGPVVRLNLGPQDPTLDPARAEMGPSAFVVNQLFLGLTRADDETGEPVPELATAWQMSPGATVFTFTLRSDVRWTDGNPVTAYDVRYGILRALNPATGAPLVSLLFAIRNAQAYAEGSLVDPNQVGIRALDAGHLRFELREPAAYLPSVLAMPVARALPAWAVVAHPTDWTEPAHIVTNGPYRLASWAHGTSLVLEKNPGSHQAGQAQIERVVLSLLDEASAWAMYLGGHLDSVRVPPAAWSATQSDSTLRGQLHAAPARGTYYFGFNTARAPFDRPLVRKAFAAAVDRQAVVELVAAHADPGNSRTVQGLAEALTFTAPGVVGHVDGRSEGVGIAYDPAQARLWLAAAGYPEGRGLPPITLAYNAHALHQAVAEELRRSWAENLGVTVTLSSTASFQDYTALLNSDPPQVWRLGWVADHPDAYNVLYDPLLPYRARFGGWRNPTYDALLAQAAQTADLSARRLLYAQAEEILVETDAVLLPLYYFADGLATRPHLERTYSDYGFGGRVVDWRIRRRLALPVVLRLSP